MPCGQRVFIERHAMGEPLLENPLIKRAAVPGFYLLASILFWILLDAHWVTAFLSGPLQSLGFAVEEMRGGFPAWGFTGMWLAIWGLGFWIFCRVFNGDGVRKPQVVLLVALWVISGGMNVFFFGIRGL